MQEFFKHAPEIHVAVGAHMTIDMKTYPERILPDGSILPPGEKVGIIHFSRNFTALRKHENIISVGRRLFRSAQISLYRLAELCEKNAKPLEGVNFFLGASHIVGPLARKLGFNIFPIKNPGERRMVKQKSEKFVREVAKENPHWQQFEKNFKAPKIAMISKETLLKLYGSQSRQPHPHKKEKPEHAVNF